MNIIAAKVTGQSIEKNRDGERNVRMLQVEITEPDDVQKVQQVTWSGDDNAPSEGDDVYIIEVSPTYKIAVSIEDLIEPFVNKGEREIYSQANGVKKAKAYFKNNGDLIINDGVKGAARLDDAIKSTSVEDPAFWAWAIRYNTFNVAWAAALAALLVGNGSAVAVRAYATTMQVLLVTLGVIPDTLTGKIIEASATVKIGD